MDKSKTYLRVARTRRAREVDMKSIYARGKRFYAKQRPAFVVIYILMFLTMLCVQFLPQATQLVINRVLYPLLGGEVPNNESSIFLPFVAGFASDDYVGILSVLTVIIVVILTIRYAGHYVRYNMVHVYYQRAADSNREAGFSHFLEQSPLVLSKYTSGELLNFLNGDIDALRLLQSSHTPVIISQVCSIIISLIFLVRINPWLALAPALVGVSVFFIARVYNGKVRRMHKRIRESNVDLNTCIQENINGVRVVRSFAAEEQELKKFERKNCKFRDNYIRLADINAKYWMVFRLLGLIVTVVSIILGIVIVISTNGGGMSVGEFSTFVSYATSINSYIISIATTVGSVQQSIVYGNRQLDFIDEEIAVTGPENAEAMPSEPTYEFRDVHMSIDGKIALDGVSFTLPYGAKVGIMGRTGSGKSVIMKLMNRFYDVTGGEILVNGKDIKQYDVSSVRKATSFVMQDVFLFSDTVTENIAYCETGEIDEDKVKKSAETACAAHFTAKLDDGYDTVVGERGLGLSGGQKQRLSIARALYKDAPVLLLDDCTSALDYETEQKIIGSLGEQCGNKTLVIATHRANSVALCDIIIYLENGKIAEMGTPAELIEKKGKYYDVLKQQESVSEEV